MSVAIPDALGPEELAPLVTATPFRRAAIARRAIRQRRVQFGLLLTVPIVAIAFLGRLVAPHSAAALVGAPFQKPTGAFPLGTDYLGHDVLSVALSGGLTVVWMSVSAVVLGLLVGVSIGLLAAYSRGTLDDVLMRSMDVLLAFPGIVLVLLFVSIIGPKLWLIVLIVGAVWTPQIARIARGAALEIVDREFVQAAEALALPRWKVLGREILPNISGTLLVDAGLRLPWSISVIASVSFLGFGVQAPAADWGLMINQNRPALTYQPWGVVCPIICIALLTVGTNLIADGFARALTSRDAMSGAT